MFKNLLLGAMLLVLISGAAACGGAKPATPENPKAEPVVTRTAAITAEELVRQTLEDPNKYKKGVILHVSGKIVMKYFTEWNLLQDVAFLLGSSQKGFRAIVIVDDIRFGDWTSAPIGSQIVVSGEYDGFREVKNVNVDSNISGNGPVLIHPRLISRE